MNNPNHLKEPILIRPAQTAFTTLVLFFILFTGVFILTLFTKPQKDKNIPSAGQMISSGGAYTGWIAFRSDRDEGGLYVINPESKTVERISNEQIYQDALLRDSISPDSSSAVYPAAVSTPALGNDLFVRRVSNGWTEKIIGNSGEDIEPAWSPDGYSIAYVNQLGGVEDIHILNLTSNQDTQIVHTDGAPNRHPSWSPTGEWLVYWTQETAKRQLWLMNTKTGAYQRLSNGQSNDWDPVWIKPPLAMQLSPTPGGPDDLEILMTVKECLADGSSQVDYLVRDTTHGQSPITRVQVRVGEHVVYDSGAITKNRISSKFEYTSIRTAETTGQSMVLLKAWNSTTFRLSPKIKQLESKCSTLKKVPQEIAQFLPSTPTPQNPQIKPEPTPTPMPEEQYLNKVIFYSDRDGGTALYLMNEDGSNPTRVQEDLNAFTHYTQAQKSWATSPDQQSIVFSSIMMESQSLYQFNFVEGWIWRLTNSDGRDLQPSWSPDGKSILFSRTFEENSEIMILDLQTLVTKELTENTWEEDSAPCFLPDGQQILFTSNRLTGNRQIWKMALNGSGLKNLSNNSHNDWDPLWIRSSVSPIRQSNSNGTASQPTVMSTPAPLMQIIR